MNVNFALLCSRWQFAPAPVLKFCLSRLTTTSRSLSISLLGSAALLLGPLLSPLQAAPLAFCQQTPAAIAQKETLRLAALRGDREAQQRYRKVLSQHASYLRKCRSQSWPENQALWIRLYPCDAKSGALDAVLDRIVNRGYNQVYVETFYNGKVLLPFSKNSTSWPSVLQERGLEKVDLLEQAIRKGRERGLKTYAWLFSMNFGSSYVARPDKQETIARNGLGQTSLTARTVAGLSTELGQFNPDEAFIDPYSVQARQDYAQLVKTVAQYRPDGILFDYIRYPRGYGAASVAAKVQDLWIYGEASQQVLLRRALNYKGLGLILRFLNRGYITTEDVNQVNVLYPKEREPLWQGLNPRQNTASLPPSKRAATLQAGLWQLTLAHAFQGVLDFLLAAVAPVQQQGIAAGAVFFPDGNLNVGQGYDSRLQPWERFPKSLEWHPMSYAVCGQSNCIMAQVQRVLGAAPPGTQVKPVLAGIWQAPISNRPPLEVQMQALYRMAPKIKSVSHFAYSWQEPGSDRERKFCQL